MFTFTPKHQKIVDACYTNNNLDTQKLSILIHHIELKHERIFKITKYLRQKIKQEIKNKSIDITCQIVLTLLSKFTDRTNYESSIIKIVNTAIKQIIRRGIVEYGKLLEVIKEFESGMRTYDGEKEVKKLLYLVTNALNRTNMDCDQSEESSSVFNEWRVDLTVFFFDILTLVIRINEIFNTEYENKYLCVLQAICKYKNSNCLMHLCRAVNIITVRKFSRILVDMASRNAFDCLDVCIKGLDSTFFIFIVIESHYYLVDRINDIFEILKKENQMLKNDECKTSVVNKEEGSINNFENVILTKTIPIDISYTFYDHMNVLQTKLCVINMPKILKRTEEEHSDIFLIYKWNYALLYFGITNQNILEVSQSFFYLLKNIYRQKTQTKKDELKNTDYELESLSFCSYNFVITYIMTYLEKSESTADILFLFVKKAFQHDLSTTSNTSSTFSIQFQTRILDIVRVCGQMQIAIFDAKFIAIITKISENIHFRDVCYLILQTILPRADITNDDRKAVLLKLRSSYFINHSSILLKILEDFVLNFPADENELTIFIMLYVTKAKGQLSTFKTFCEMNGFGHLYEKYVTKELEYDPEKDTKFYDEVMGGNYRFYSHSLKSTINLENLKAKRKSYITRIKFFN